MCVTLLPQEINVTAADPLPGPQNTKNQTLTQVQQGTNWRVLLLLSPTGQHLTSPEVAVLVRSGLSVLFCWNS